jgi:hypothetical protein
MTMHFWKDGRFGQRFGGGLQDIVIFLRLFGGIALGRNGFIQTEVCGCEDPARPDGYWRFD